MPPVSLKPWVPSQAPPGNHHYQPVLYLPEFLQYGYISKYDFPRLIIFFKAAHSTYCSALRFLHLKIHPGALSITVPWAPAVFWQPHSRTVDCWGINRNSHNRSSVQSALWVPVFRSYKQCSCVCIISHMFKSIICTPPLFFLLG